MNSDGDDADDDFFFFGSCAGPALALLQFLTWSNRLQIELSQTLTEPVWLKWSSYWLSPLLSLYFSKPEVKQIVKPNRKVFNKRYSSSLMASPSCMLLQIELARWSLALLWFMFLCISLDFSLHAYLLLCDLNDLAGRTGSEIMKDINIYIILVVFFS